MRPNILGLAAALVIFAVAGLDQAQAQTYGATTFGAVPRVVTAGATSNINQVIDVRGYRTIGVALSGKAHSSTNSVLIATFARSLDGSTYESTSGSGIPFVLYHIIPTNSVSTTVTNFDLGGVGWLKLTTLVVSGTAVTNPAVVISTKPAF